MQWKDAKASNVLERIKDETVKSLNHDNHNKETHGTSDDIDENTPADEVKGPGILHRVKEELEAVVEAFLPKKDSDDHHWCCFGVFAANEVQKTLLFAHKQNKKVAYLCLFDVDFKGCMYNKCVDGNESWTYILFKIMRLKF